MIYLVGVITVPLVAATGFALFVGYFGFTHWLDRHGWFIEWGGKVGEEFDHGYVRRDILWKRGRLWSGQVVNEGAHITRFVGFGWHYFGARAGYTKVRS